jgi:TolB protein
MDADRKNQRNLTKDPAYDGCPGWSPDDGKIAFASWRDGNMEIYVMDSDGKNIHRLTYHPARDTCPAWFDAAFAYSVSPVGRLKGTWGWIKRDRE